MDQDDVTSCETAAAARVLLIGTYPPLTRALRRGLEEEGFAVDVACPGRGKGIPVGDGYDAVVVDMKSSGDALPPVRRRCGLRAPVLALASPDGPGELTPAVDAWLAKPFDLNDLLTRLHALVRGTQTQPRSDHAPGAAPRCPLRPGKGCPLPAPPAATLHDEVV
jgi:DNA-binding response OmpR family regulator